MKLFRIVLIGIFYPGICFSWNPVLQHNDINSIIFEDQTINALADQLGVDRDIIFNQVTDYDNGRSFSSFDTWEHFRCNWRNTANISYELKELLHCIEDCSVPVNHSPGNNCFNRNNSSVADPWESIIEYVPLCDCNGFLDCLSKCATYAVTFYPIQLTVSYELTNVSRLRRDFAGDNLYNERFYQNQLSLNTATDYITYYNNLLALHKQRVESEACSFKSYVEGSGLDPRDYMARGYSEAVSLGREIVRIYLNCRLHPEAWDNPPVVKKPDLTPVLNLLLDD